MAQNVLLWDFDGTLGFRVNGMWSSALLETLNDYDSGHTITLDDIKPLVKNGFPWHQPDIEHTHLNSPNAWWDHLKSSVIIKVYITLGYSEIESKLLADMVHQKYIDLKCWSLYDDAIPTLQLLTEKGWTHIIVSNHVPELENIIDGLGLEKYISEVINSAITGYEKPHSEIYKIALEKTKRPKNIWMIGDNFIADVLGAEAVGIKGILVHTNNENAIRQCNRLSHIPKLLEQFI